MKTMTNLHCPNCNDVRPFRRNVPNHVMHLLLTLLTMGFWLIVWILVALSSEPYICTTCGHKL
jgi:hypothetical protein